MRGAKSAKWVIGAAVVALAATACGSNSSDTKAGGSNDGIVRAWWGDPQNPLEAGEHQ